MCTIKPTSTCLRNGRKKREEKKKCIVSAFKMDSPTSPSHHLSSQPRFAHALHCPSPLMPDIMRASCTSIVTCMRNIYTGYSVHDFGETVFFNEESRRELNGSIRNKWVRSFRPRAMFRLSNASLQTFPRTPCTSSHLRMHTRVRPPDNTPSRQDRKATLYARCEMVSR